MKRFLFAFFMSAFVTGSASAQRRSTVYSNNAAPGSWFTAGVGGFTGTGVNDGASGSTWDFGNSTNLQYRASLEKALASGSSFGVSGSWSHVPFVYTSSTGIGSGDAHLDMMTLLATFHVGGGQGFHQVIEFNGGVVAYRNLKSDLDGTTLAPSGGNIDPLFSFGYGIGYGFGPRTQIDFVPNGAIAIHERSGLPNGTSNTNSMRSLQLTLRMGF
ncbi:MAG: hypothetical protein ACR2NS_01120 [Gemmatimonadaceae bacterium]